MSSHTPILADEVHLWQVALACNREQRERLYATLDAEERARAARYHFRQLRDRFVVGRGALRAILGACLGIAPEAVRFRYGPHGKPALSQGTDRDGLCFNVSHSGALALIAVTRDRQLGVDLEQLRPELAEPAVAAHFFSPREVAALAQTPATEYPAAFFRCWTRKEALVKATGLGLSLPLDSFDVSLAADEPARLLATRWHPPQDERWSLVALPCAPGYVAALAVEGDDWRLVRHRWAH